MTLAAEHFTKQGVHPMSRTVFSDSIEQIWNNGDTSAIERFIAFEYEGYDPAPIIGIEGYKQHFVTLTNAFSDIRITIEDILAEGERVAAR
jgi:predicted ester cyclase